ncbi:MAG: hypothetical protein DPW20_17670 [Candidatus Brocadia sp.]|nr:hypothetical protein [Candidatus Brocadia sp.]
MFGKNLCSKAFLFGFKGKFSIERTIRKQSMVSYQWSVCNEKAGWWLNEAPEVITYTDEEIFEKLGPAHTGTLGADRAF